MTTGENKGLVVYRGHTQQGYSNARIGHELRRQLNLREKTGHITIVNPDPLYYNEKFHVILNGEKILLLGKDDWQQYVQILKKS